MIHENVHKVIRKHMIPRRVMNILPRKVMPICCPRNYGRRLLTNIYKELGFKKGAEIGVSRARHAFHMLDNVPDLVLYCIDPWTEYEGYIERSTQDRHNRIHETAMNRLRSFLQDNRAIIIKKHSMDALDDIRDESLDFVYIDGNHDYDYVATDIIFWSHKVRSGGMVGVHDYYSGYVGIIDAVQSYTRSHDIIPWYVTKELEPTAFWVVP